MLRKWAVPVLMVFCLGVANASAQEKHFRVLAGASPAGSNDGTGGDARFNVPTGVAVDSEGTVYVTDSQNYVIRKITSAGAVTTFAGEAGAFGSANGVGSSARFGAPQGAAVDGAGNVYIADTSNHTIRMITPGGVVSTLAGLAGSPGITDNTGSAARFSRPVGVAVDSAGTVYVADTGNHTIRKITPAGVVTTLAGFPGSPGTTDATGNNARFNQPRGIAVDGAGVLYVADTSNHSIRKIAAGAVVTTLAGLSGTFGNVDDTGSAARFNNPRGVAVDSAGTTVYVADTNNNNIRQVTAAGVVTRLAGATAPGGFDGTGTGARFNAPEAVSVDSAGVVYVADTVSDTIRKISAGGVVTTLAGFYGSLGAVDGSEQTARFAMPFAVAVDASGNVYVADRANSTIRKVTRAGNVTTFAGLANSPGTIDGTGSAARFSAPQGIAVDSAGTVYVADGVGTIRTITPAGVVTTLAGQAFQNGSTDGIGTAARFNGPRGLAVDSAGNVYVADQLNHTIRKIAPGGIVTTLAGLAGAIGSTDGTGSAARFSSPRGVAVDAAGTVFVTDTINNTIRQITPAGVVTTLAGQPGVFGSNDGTGGGARFGGPQAIAADDNGTLYVADTNNNTIRKITAGAVVTTISGCPGCIGNENWNRFNAPQGIAVSANGDLYVADTRNNTIRSTIPIKSSLIVDFGPSYGIWIRRGTTWSQLHPFTAEAAIRVQDGDSDGLVIDFGPGVGVWFWKKEADGDEVWFQLHPSSPTAMVGVDFDGDGEVESGVFDFAGQGLWLFDGDEEEWAPLHPFNVSHLIAADVNGDGGEDVVVNFPGYGLWVYSNGTWSQLHPFDVTSIVVGDLDGNDRSDVVVNFPGFGVWSYLNGTNWAQIHQFDANRLAAGDLDGNGVSDLVIDFGALYGVWVRQNGATWTTLHPLTTDGITTGDLDGNGHDEVIIDFGAAGVWSYEDLGGWQQVHTLNPKAIATGHFY